MSSSLCDTLGFVLASMPASILRNGTLCGQTIVPSGGEMDIVGDLLVTGDVGISGTLEVLSTSYFEDVVVSGAISFSSFTVENLTVTGNTVLASATITTATIGALASATVGNLTVTGNSSFQFLSAVTAAISDAVIDDLDAYGVSVIASAAIGTAVITTATIASASIASATIGNLTVTGAFNFGNVATLVASSAVLTAATIASATLGTANITGGLDVGGFALINEMAVFSATITTATIVDLEVGLLNVNSATVNAATVASETVGFERNTGQFLPLGSGPNLVWWAPLVGPINVIPVNNGTTVVSMTAPPFFSSPTGYYTSATPSPGQLVVNNTGLYQTTFSGLITGVAGNTVTSGNDYITLTQYLNNTVTVVTSNSVSMPNSADGTGRYFSASFTSLMSAGDSFNCSLTNNEPNPVTLDWIHTRFLVSKIG